MVEGSIDAAERVPSSLCTRTFSLRPSPAAQPAAPLALSCPRLNDRVTKLAAFRLGCGDSEAPPPLQKTPAGR